MTTISLGLIAGGAVSSLGLTLASTHAAVHAGLANFSETFFLGPGHTRIVGAQIPRGALDLPGEAEGAIVGGETRLDAMLTRAVAECLAAAPNVPTPRIALILVGPEAARLHDPTGWFGRRRDACEAALGRRFDPASHEFAEGSPGLASALGLAQQLLTHQPDGACLIAAVDSLLNAADMRVLLDGDRVLTRDVREGLVPGEAAACVLLTRSHDAPIRILGVGQAHDPDNRAADQPARGVGLAQAARVAFQQAALGPHDIRTRYADVTGEAHAFEDVAYAWTRLLRRASPEGAHYETPVTSTGYVGAGMGLLLLALTLAEAGHHGPNDPTLILLGSHGSGRGAVVACTGSLASMPLRPVNDGRTLPTLLAQHAEDSAFYHTQHHSFALRSNHTPRSQRDLVELRDAHLAGLIIAEREGASAPGWRAASDPLHEPTFGAVFVAARLALAGDDSVADQRLHSVEAALQDLEADEEAPDFAEALDAALVPFPVEGPVLARCIERWRVAPLATLRRAAFLALLRGGRELAPILTATLGDPDPYTRACALRACGTLGLHERRPQLLAALSMPASIVRRWAAWSLARLGDSSGREVLLDWLLASDGDPYPASALAAILDEAACTRQIDRMLVDEASLRAGLELIRYSGALRWADELCTRMSVPAFAQRAADVFAHITGAPLSTAGMWRAPPTSAPPGDDDPEVAVADKQPPDEELPWPDPDGVRRWWARARTSDPRPHLAGQPLTPVWAQAVLADQDLSLRQHHHAAWYLSTRRITPA
jgi:3-oxoacyl-[acyl-carrier-protein] synthase-1